MGRLEVASRLQSLGQSLDFCGLICFFKEKERSEIGRKEESQQTVIMSLHCLLLTILTNCYFPVSVCDQCS